MAKKQKKTKPKSETVAGPQYDSETLERLQQFYRMIQNTREVDWDFLLTDVSRQKLVEKFGLKQPFRFVFSSYGWVIDDGTERYPNALKAWAAVRGYSPARAVLEIAAHTSCTYDSEYRKLLRSIGEAPQQLQFVRANKKTKRKPKRKVTK